jgi:hypothetical protein
MEHNHLSDKVADALRKAAVELEEFQVQFALGKAEAKDKYEEVKKSFNHFVHETKMKMQEGKEKSDDLIARFEALQVQLNLGIAEGKEAFNAQRLKILSALQQLEEKILSSPVAEPWVHLLKVEVEKFKIKLEILRLRYELGKMDATEEFEKRKSEFLDKISEMKSKFSDLIK